MSTALSTLYNVLAMEQRSSQQTRSDNAVPTIADVFMEDCPDLVVDNRFYLRIRNYDRGFVTKNPDHSNFFGGNLIGVYTVRWSEVDKNVWYDDILIADEAELKRDIRSLPSIDPSFKVSSDPVNLSCLWLIHQFHHASKLSQAKRDEGKLMVMRILHYKFISSLLYRFFKYPARKEVAEAAYDLLSRRFQLKQAGSWGKFIDMRSQDLLSKNSIHYKTYVDFNDDEAIIAMVNDIQTRIRQTFKNINNVFYDVLRSGTGTKSTTTKLVELDGEVALRDQHRNIPIYQRYIAGIINDANSFIRSELVDVVTSTMSSVAPKSFLEILRYVSLQYGQPKFDYVSELVSETISHGLEYMSERRIRSTDLVNLVTQLKRTYTSSMASDPNLKHIKALAMDLVDKSSRSKSSSIKAAERTGLLMYIVLRTLTMKHYS